MDIEIIETGNGGDLNRKGNDLAVIFGFQNMPYLAMFGGNPEADTPQIRLENEQSFDYWGNSLLWSNNKGMQFNSLTERALNTTPLTSAGRLIIEEAIKKDLEFMRDFAEITVETEIIATDVIKISIWLKEPDNLEVKEYIYIWDGIKLDLINSNYVENENIIDLEGLQYEIQFYL